MFSSRTLTLVSFGSTLCFVGWKTASKRLYSNSSNVHYLLHFDINKTLIMVDHVQQKTMHSVINDILCECAWGKPITANENDVLSLNKQQWVLDETLPITPHKPDIKDGELLCYAEWINKNLPYGDHVSMSVKAQRRALKTSFTDKGHPGYSLYKSEYCKLNDILMGKQDRDKNEAIAKNGENHSILSSFWNMFNDLNKMNQSFSIIFRTFGTELDHIMNEFNQYVTSINKNELMLKNENVGIIVRDKNGTHLIMGCNNEFDPNRITKTTNLTLDKLLAMDRMEYYRNKMNDNGSNGLNNVKIITNESNIYKYIVNKTINLKETMAICDDYIFWAMNNESSDSGKIMIMDTNNNDNFENGNIHQIFFDDNLGFDKPYIVDVRDLAVKNSDSNVDNVKNDKHECKSIGDEQFNLFLKDTHLVKVEPYDVITNENYFLEKINQCRAALKAWCSNSP